MQGRAAIRTQKRHLEVVRTGEVISLSLSFISLMPTQPKQPNSMAAELSVCRIYFDNRYCYLSFDFFLFFSFG